MKLIVGLGNPGEEYKNTRHNIGFLVLDELQKTKLPKDLVLRKSDVFMNNSGSFVKKLTDKYKLDLSGLYIIHDDLDIKLGEHKIQFGRGPKDHNGLKSVDESLRTDQYWHVRIGVDNRPEDGRPMGEEYVLQNFTPEEREVLDKTIKEVCHKLISNFQLPIANGK
jgi:PTH1 family peptidyl-tRNA hydrolase